MRFIKLHLSRYFPLISHDLVLTSTKEGQTYYAFENIPYAKQPVKERRFKAAEAYTYNDEVDDPPLNDGSKTVVCPQEQVGCKCYP